MRSVGPVFVTRLGTRIRAGAIRAVEQVREFGGVLEHPADSRLWDVCDLPRPWCLPDAWGGYTVAVDQCDFGHVARKTTWLYLVGVPRSALIFPPRREPTHWVAGGRVSNPEHRRTLVPPGIKVCSAQQRRRTPHDFARYLVSLGSRAVVPAPGTAGKVRGCRVAETRGPTRSTRHAR